MRVLWLLTASCLLASTASASSMLGGKKCTWGPSWWCSSLPASAECAATKHCIRRVWVDLRLEPDNDDVCTICKNMVKEARDTLESNETQEELKEVFEGSCKLIPIQIVAEECIKLADQFAPELIDTLASELNPQVVCATAGLCNSRRVDRLLEQHTNRQGARVGVTECDVCTAQAKITAKRFKELDPDRMVDKLLEMCGYWNAYSDACKATVLDNFDMIRSMLTSLDGNVCLLSGICSESNRGVAAKVRAGAAPNDIQCEFCEKVIQHWVDTWTANTTEAEFKTVLEALCKKLDRPERVDRCLHIVDDYYVPWFNYLLHQVDPHAICSLVGLCGNNGFMQVDSRASINLLLAPEPKPTPKIRMLPLRPAIKITGNERRGPKTASKAEARGKQRDNSQVVGGFFEPATALELGKPGCVICEFTMQQVNRLTDGDYSNPDFVAAAVNNVCGVMPNGVTAQCSNLISTYGPAVSELLSRSVAPAHVCSLLGVCSSDDLLTQHVSQPTSELQVLKRGQDSCALCEFVMTSVYSALSDASTRHQIVNVLDTVCYRALPQNLRNECEKLVAEYTAPLIDMIIKSFTPDQICAKIRLCAAKDVSGTAIDVPKTTALMVVNIHDQECVLCEYVITTLDKMLTDRHNVDSVKRALDRLCSYLPRTVTDKCVNFVDTYSEMIIDLIVHDVSPEQICSQLGLCSTISELKATSSLSTTSDIDMDSMLTRVDEIVDEAQLQGKDTPYCTLCEYAIGEVDRLLSDNKTEQEIKDVLDRICYELSQPIMKNCVDLVNTYTDQIIKMFLADYTPEQVCAAVGLCPKKKSNSLRLDSNSITSNVIPPANKNALQVGGPTPLCVLCEFVLSVVEEQILTNRTVDMLERGMQMICAYMPRTVAEPCERFIDEYGDKILDLILREELNPKVFCTEISLCMGATPPKPKPIGVKAVGGSGCIWGPSYWCQSKFHAKACGTTKHCQEHVWNK